MKVKGTGSRGGRRRWRLFRRGLIAQVFYAWSVYIYTMDAPQRNHTRRNLGSVGNFTQFDRLVINGSRQEVLDEALYWMVE